MIDRAIALRPLLRETQAETEKRTYIVEEVQQACVRAGFYRLYVPRRYGGYEFDVTTFVRVVLELAKGDPSAAWCLGLASGHALAVAGGAPLGPATRVEDGWELNGKVSYCSGIPSSTHYMGQALLPEQDGELPRM